MAVEKCLPRVEEETCRSGGRLHSWRIRQRRPRLLQLMLIWEEGWGAVGLDLEDHQEAVVEECQEGDRET